MPSAPVKTQSRQPPARARLASADVTGIAHEHSKRSRRGAVRRGLLILALLVLLGGVSIAPIFPRGFTPAVATPDVFSAERAMVHLPTIAAEPHPSGSPAQARVRAYLLEQLNALGLDTQVQSISSGGVQNVIARVRGSDSTGAVLLVSHYDSVPMGPGAADNGSGVAALLESMRALAAGPQLRNDVIALFDDGEEMGFVGVRAFIADHPWMRDVRVVVGADTAVAGPINVNQTGPRNGWLIQALARAYTGGLWNSATGGSGYFEYSPFRDSGVQGLELEDNYAFREQHTQLDRPQIVNAASVQQLGDQVLAITRELGAQDLNNPWSEQEIFFSLPPFGFVHYPQAWSVPLAVSAVALLLVAAAVALRRRIASWRGLAVALVSITAAAAVGGFSVGSLWARVPEAFGWDTAAWPEWPEVIPPSGERFLVAFGLLVLGVTVAAYVLARRVCWRFDLVLASLTLWALVAVLLSIAEPRMAYFALWPALLGGCGALVGAVLLADRMDTRTDLVGLPGAATATLVVVIMFPTALMSDGLISAGVVAGVWALVVAVCLPTLDGLVSARGSD